MNGICKNKRGDTDADFLFLDTFPSQDGIEWMNKKHMRFFENGIPCMEGNILIFERVLRVYFEILWRWVWKNKMNMIFFSKISFLRVSFVGWCIHGKGVLK